MIFDDKGLFCLFVIKNRGPVGQNFVIVKTSTRKVNANYISKYTVIFCG